MQLRLSNELRQRKIAIAVDWIIADMLAVRQGSIGRIRYILKDGLKYFPLYGFYFRQVCSPTVVFGDVTCEGKRKVIYEYCHQNS